MLAVCIGLALLGGQSQAAQTRRAAPAAPVAVAPQGRAVWVAATDDAVAATVVAHLRAAGYQPSLDEPGAADDALQLTVQHDGDTWEVIGVGQDGVSVVRNVADGDPVSVGEALGQVSSAVVASVMDAEVEPEPIPVIVEVLTATVPGTEPKAEPKSRSQLPVEAKRTLRPSGTSNLYDTEAGSPPVTVPVGLTAGYLGSNYSRAFGWHNALSLRLTGTPRRGYVGGSYDFVAPAGEEVRIRHRVGGVHGGYRWTQRRWDVRAGAQAQLDVVGLPTRAGRPTRRLVVPSVGPEVGVGLVAVGPLRVRARLGLQIPLRQARVALFRSDPVRVQVGLAFELGNTHPPTKRSATLTARRGRDTSATQKK